MGMDVEPMVSVMMISYNQEEFIDEAIRGVMLQKVPFDIELIIGDDCSTDSTAERCRYWQQKYPDIIRILPRERNLGVQRNYIDVYNHCRGKYIAVCEGDDYWFDRSKLRRQVEYMEGHKDCTVCFHRVVNYFTDTRTMSLSNGGQKRDTSIADLSRSNYITNLSVMYRRGVFGALPDWVEQVTAPDYTFHMLHASKGKIHYMNRPMAVYRQSSKGVWSKAGAERRLRMSLLARKNLIDYFSGVRDIVEGLMESSVSVAISLVIYLENEGRYDEATEVRHLVRQYRKDWSKEDVTQAIESRRMELSHASGFSINKIAKKCRAVVSYFLPRPRIGFF